MPPEFIYFDLGNVLLSFDHTVASSRIAQLTGVPEPVVWQLVFQGDLETRYECGELSDEEFCDAFRAATGCRVASDQLLWAASAMFEANPPVVPIVQSLCRAGHRLGILSNTCAAHWRYITQGEYPYVWESFEVCILSFQCRVMKPDSRIYQAAAAATGLEPCQIFFVDDRLENVLAARRCGLDAEQFLNARLLVEQLRQRGVEVEG